MVVPRRVITKSSLLLELLLLLLHLGHHLLEARLAAQVREHLRVHLVHHLRHRRRVHVVQVPARHHAAANTLRQARGGRSGEDGRRGGRWRWRWGR
eukprot:scaffold93241_cov33-Phaeocystis_antarctica.AAC.1